MHYQVLISGGGIAGLTLALKLVSQGIHVLVIEKDLSPSIKYKGELLQPKSLQILDHLGIIDDVLIHSYPIHTTHLIEQSSLVRHPIKSTFSLDYRQLQTPYAHAVMMPHEKLKHLILAKAKTYPSFHMIQPGRLLNIDDHTAQIRTPEGVIDVTADYIFGAEGKVSVVRKKMNVRLGIQRYNHQFFTLATPRPPSITEARVIYRDHRFLGLFPLPDHNIRIVYLIRSGELKGYSQNGLSKLLREISLIEPEMTGYVDQIQDWNQIELMVPQRHNANIYAHGHLAILGDAAHSVHPMAGEGMNLAIQDADVLGELVKWLLLKKPDDPIGLKWYEQVRKPRAEFVSQFSHLSALAYSFPYDWLTPFRIKILQRIASIDYFHTQHMINIAGIGLCPPTVLDRLIQMGLLPGKWRQVPLDQEKYRFTEEEDYPWLKEMKRS